MSVAKLVTPQYIYSNIVEHLRSQIDVAELRASELSSFEIEDVAIKAFGTRYYFRVLRESEKRVESTSMLLLSHPPKAKAEFVQIREIWSGWLDEFLEPGQERAQFDFQATREVF